MEIGTNKYYPYPMLSREETDQMMFNRPDPSAFMAEWDRARNGRQVARAGDSRYRPGEWAPWQAQAVTVRSGEAYGRYGWTENRYAG
ncbi:MAG: hypothetical protein J6U01_03260 [Clostridia bacterium]|nr:hypothetical protein [Clostridia bacterium]